MKIKRKKRIIISNNDNNMHIIFIASNCYINNKKKLNLNKTKLFYTQQNTFILPFNNSLLNTDTLSSEYNINKKNIKEIINIYKNKLFIVVIDFNTTINNLKEHNYLDIFTPSSTSIYNDILNYTINYKNSYLNRVLTNTNNNIKLKVIDLYYYVIGYI